VDKDPDLPYQALYRRFRPQRFSEVLGQEHVTRALRAAVRDAKVAHAYLFSGPRGTGKTSTARILAMALNCERPEDGEPCGECQSCVSIRGGSSLDVVELDSATNRGIDEMRDLLSRVSLGTPGRWKVYIVDEVHQITAAAASALLKTLEEPPGHVIFVLATTDPQKVLDTIRSRTQHFEFRLLGTDVLSSLLAEVAKRAEIDLTDEAMDVVVRRGHGSARDALSALDQVAAAGAAHDDSGLVTDLVEALVERDAAGALVKVAEAAQSGLDARRLATELLEHLRNGFLATRAPDLVLLAPSAAATVRSQAERLGPAAVVRAMEEVGRAVIDMRDSADARTTLEVALVRLAAPELDDGRTALLERIERLERALAGGAVRAPASGGSPQGTPPSGPAPSSPPAPSNPVPSGPSSSSSLPPAPPQPRPARPSSPASRPPAPPAPAVAATGAAPVPTAPSAPPSGGAAPSREELTMAWGDRILPSLRPAVKVYVATGRFLPSEASTAVYAVPDRGLLTRAEANRAEVEQALSSHFGRPVALRLVLDDGPPARNAPGAAEPAPAGPGTIDDEAAVDWAELEEAPATVSSPEEKLLQAFPGAEEVQP
jgi:DNA polymerase-3 subunit gamma/tau